MKLIVGVLTPLSVAIIAFWIDHRLKKFEQLQWASQKVIERRLQLYEELAPSLNDLLCYFTYIGCWKDLTPLEVVKLKRVLDKICFVNAPLFPPEFLAKYNAFMNLCYGTFTGWGRDAQLKTKNGRRIEAYENEWRKEWDQCFVPESEVTDPGAIRDAYGELMASFAGSLGIGVRSESLHTGEIPYNIH